MPYTGNVVEFALMALEYYQDVDESDLKSAGNLLSSDLTEWQEQKNKTLLRSCQSCVQGQVIGVPNWWNSSIYYRKTCRGARI